MVETTTAKLPPAWAAGLVDRVRRKGDSGGVELAYPLAVAGSDLVCAGVLLLMVAVSGCAGDDGGARHHLDWGVPQALPGAEAFGESLHGRLEGALQQRAPEYRPRTHHLTEDGAPLYTNRLILESSPYLLQHAHNPVNWYPWGDEAFEAARRLGRPVLLSVGYSTCHWCHVMERESFEDVEIASFINANYIAIKVDREERPDIDRVYMEAVQLISGRGGWPMTVVLTPDRRPFFGGTYFPARDGDRGARVGFLTILGRLATHYREHPDDITARASSLSARMAEDSSPQALAEIPSAEAIRRTVAALARGFDPRYGGFGRAPKFPRPVTLELLLRYHRRSGDDEALSMVRTTLEQMAHGGINDQIGGGFHRYSTDERWLVPHFEKMLYDNAQLALIYLDAFQATGESGFAEVARRTLDYAMREMSDDGGGFHSATDADSPAPSGHEEEGLFFTWTPAELREALGAERARLVESYYGVTEQGNFEGRSILSIVRPLKDVAEELAMTPQQAAGELEAARQALYDVRSKRRPPGKDDKVLAAWNGLMLSALARGARVLDEPRYRARAERVANFMLEEMGGEDGSLVRSWKDGRRGPPAVLDDYAFVAAGLIDLFEASGNLHWLGAARAMHDQLERRFWDDEQGGFFFTANDGEDLLIRDKPSYDGAEPSGNSVAALNLLRLYEFTDEQRYREMAERVLAAFADELSERGLAAPKLLSALDAYLDTTKEIVLVSPHSGKGSLEPFLDRLRKTYLPSHVLIQVSEQAVPQVARTVPFVEEKLARDGRPTAYVCENRVCDIPATDAETFGRQISQVRPYAD